MTEGGLLVIRWKLPSGTEIETGFRADDKSVYPKLIQSRELDTPDNVDRPDPVVLNGELE